MRVLTSAVLGFEAVVVLLSIPVAVVVGGFGAGAAWALAMLALCCALLPAAHRQPWFRPAGWALQVLLVLTGLLVPMMFALGLVFMGLWFGATLLGSKPGAGRTSG